MGDLGGRHHQDRCLAARGPVLLDWSFTGATRPAPDSTPWWVMLMPAGRSTTRGLDLTPVRFVDQPVEHEVAQVRSEREPLVAGHEKARRTRP
jgi:hypothetical protein